MEKIISSLSDSLIQVVLTCAILSENTIKNFRWACFDFLKGFISYSDDALIFKITPRPSQMVDKCAILCVCVSGGSGSKLVITRLAFSELIVGDDHVVLITCSITAKVNKGFTQEACHSVCLRAWGGVGGVCGGGVGWMAVAKVRKITSSYLLSFDLKQSNCSA